MFDPVTQNISFPELEKSWLELWERERVFERSVEQAEGRTPFVFYEGPPRSTSVVCEFGSAPNEFGAPLKSFARVRSCTCTSRPIDASHPAGIPLDWPPIHGGYHPRSRTARSEGCANFAPPCSTP